LSRNLSTAEPPKLTISAALIGFEFNAAKALAHVLNPIGNGFTDLPRAKKSKSWRSVSKKS
jgi:hypothetical protein